MVGMYIGESRMSWYITTSCRRREYLLLKVPDRLDKDAGKAKSRGYICTLQRRDGIIPNHNGLRGGNMAAAAAEEGKRGRDFSSQ